VPWHDQPFSAVLTLPPLGVVWLLPETAMPARATAGAIEAPAVRTRAKPAKPS
jgi:hypothetical protein